jgi:uncharacterized protein YecT (DUF1311 family)
MSNYRKVILSGFAILCLVGTLCAKDHSHVAEADREYAAVFSHGENPCANKFNTLDYGECIGKEVEFTETHLNAFLMAVRGILGEGSGMAPAAGSTDKASELELLNNADRSWRDYKKNLCKLEFAGFDGGSGASSAKSECEYRLSREHVKQVADAILLKNMAE